MTPRYRGERVLGRGRHASIWLARDTERLMPVALKVAQRGSLAEEYERQVACGGEHAVEAVECGQLPDGRPFIAMEYLQLGDIRNAMPGPDSIAPALRAPALRAAAAALALLHRAGWVHRDLKPAHLLLRDVHRVALCDFGSACRIGDCDGAATPRVIGTPRYAAPEQIEGAAAAPSADVYSLGVCAFELVTGKPPFRGETLTELFSQHVRAPVPRLPREVAQWQPLLDALLAKDPAARPADGEAVLALIAATTGDRS